ncbi:hypothetical protein P3W24_14325 [Luteibacter sp. PPL201]|jgi:hypothetical protein|uniref:Uncharacterized protein n=1 Tax=Luteibacter sahnii TaxID=3021977 RepID=A0ABT6BDJ4_9GAMM|nr:hypothetical protein [Luteibacter sp. PPL193]MDY1549026.1 hypothetical protein [Luteibacter sp. PPL193]
MALRAVHKRYFRELLPAMLVYCVLIVLSVYWLKTLEGTAMRTLVTLLPVVPIAFVLRAMVRVIRDQDEFERLIDLQAIAIGGGAGCFGFFTYGMLLNAKVLPVPPGEAVAIWVFPVLMFCFGVAKCLCRLHYLRQR